MERKKVGNMADDKTTGEVTELTEEAIDALTEGLAGANRRKRQEASHALALAAQENPDQLMGHVDDLVDALYRPEAQTRWEVLTALTAIASRNAELVKDAYDGAEASLFDEDSAIVRLAAFRFLVRLGASAPELSDQVWTVMDEAIQCYHGDPEYRDMLTALTEFAGGSISDATREALVTRVGFDAQNGYGYVKALSAEVIQAARG